MDYSFKLSYPHRDILLYHSKDVLNMRHFSSFTIPIYLGLSHFKNTQKNLFCKSSLGARSQVLDIWEYQELIEKCSKILKNFPITTSEFNQLTYPTLSRFSDGFNRNSYYFNLTNKGDLKILEEKNTSELIRILKDDIPSVFSKYAHFIKSDPRLISIKEGLSIIYNELHSKVSQCYLR